VSSTPSRVLKHCSGCRYLTALVPISIGGNKKNPGAYTNHSGLQWAYNGPTIGRAFSILKHTFTECNVSLGGSKTNSNNT